MTEEEWTVPDELFKDVKFYVVGDVDPKVVHLLKSGKGKEVSYNALATHIIAEDGDNPEVGESREVFDLPVVKPSWVILSVRCGDLLPVTGFSPESGQIFFGVTVCLPSVSLPDDLSALWAYVTFYGGDCQLNLNKKVTHLVVKEAKGAKFECALKHPGIKIVTPDWITDSVKDKNRKDEALYHPRLTYVEPEEEEESEGESSDMRSPSDGSYSPRRSRPSSGGSSGEESSPRRRPGPKRLNSVSPPSPRKPERRSERMFDDSDDDSPTEKEGTNLNWTPAEVVTPTAPVSTGTARRRAGPPGTRDLASSAGSGLINLCSTVPSVAGNTPPSAHSRCSLPPARIPGWSTAMITLRNITNASDVQTANRPPNVAHVKSFFTHAYCCPSPSTSSVVNPFYQQQQQQNPQQLHQQHLQQQHLLQQQQHMQHLQKQHLQNQNQQVLQLPQQQTTTLQPQHPQPPHVSQLFGHEPGLDIPQDGFLLGCVFVIADYPEQMADKQLLATWKRVIQACGGTVDPTLTSRCTHLLCESQVSNVYVQALREGKRCVTAHWLNTVLKKKRMVPPHRTLHLPFAFPPGAKPCSQHIISVTGFVDADRDDLKLMAYLAGARFTGYLCRSNTVLICKEPSGLKYEKAKEWKIACVNAQWLCDILLGNFEALRQIQHSRYSFYGHPEPLAPNPQLVQNLLAAWRTAVKVSPEALAVSLDYSTVLREIHSPSKKLPPESTPHVIFTGFEPPQVQQLTKRLHALGGELAENSLKATHLVAVKVTRTVKFLTAMSVVKHIVSPEWLEESWRSQKFVGRCIAEVLFNFSLEESLRKAHSAPLFKGKYFYLTPGVCPSFSTMKAILESAGGKLLTKQPSYRKIMEHKQNKNLPEIVLISCDNDLHLCREYFMKNIDVHNAEFILTGVLTQKLDYQSYPFS
uniref:PAX-interacting protein 1 n=1 Tax=Oryzias sinensis TaxID=183150 RepID=A0A8C7XCX1_9TELE